MTARKLLKRRPWPGALLRCLGHKSWAVERTATGIAFDGGRHQAPFSSWAASVRITRTWGLTSIEIPLASGQVATLAGITTRDALSFVSAANEDFSAHLLRRFTMAEDELKALSEAIGRLDRPRRYPAACLLGPFLTRAIAINALFPAAIPDGVFSEDQRQLIETVRSFQAAPGNARNAAAQRFIDSDLINMKQLFDTIEQNPLTPEQRLAVVTDEDATLVLAGAGSGKTSVIVAKAAYLIARDIRQPHEILLLAFGKDAAAEMAGRIKKRAGQDVDAMTFHALGNRIIRAVEGKGPPLADHASDDAKLRVLLRDILLNEVASTAGVGRLLVDWFLGLLQPYKSEWDFTTRDEYFQWVETQDLRTLNGDRVRSREELEISNWLYRNGIAHEYEPVYDGQLPADARGAYKPDFRLTESGIYIEHFGVRKVRKPDGSIRLATAPHMDSEKYLADMEWKRDVHKTNGTTLIETFSYENVEGKLLDNLQKKLAPYVKLKPVAPEQLFDTLGEMGLVDSFTQTLGTFLRHFKGSGATFAGCEARAAQSEDRPRTFAFLKIFSCLFDAYQARLGDQIDFEDMIVRATAYVESGRFNSPYRHILVDEFQDISIGRSRLVRALKAQYQDARLFAVGDDWQSIYRFSGADIYLMRGFGKEFGGRFADDDAVHSVVDLGRTFRSVDKIAYPARSFVLRNPAQIEKTVIPAATTSAPAIMVAYYEWGQEGDALRKALERAAAGATPGTSVLLLGRYRHTEPQSLGILTKQFPHLSLRFMTVHASKGLEADHVIILRAVSDTMGFPSEIVDDPVLDLVLPIPESFAHAEERRLFYVALTRARKSVTILAHREKPSSFARELVKHPEYQAIEIGKPGIADQRCLSCGGRMLAQTARSGGTYFACEHRYLCGHKINACSTCGSDLPIQDVNDTDKLVCSCGTSFPACTECTGGWLVERRGRNGTFLGCVNYPVCKGTRNLPERGARAGSRNRATRGHDRRAHSPCE